MKQSAPKPRRRGRPKASEVSGAALRETVITAATTIYARHGFQRSTVERIIQAANISRPTFYKLFRDRTEVIDIIVARANDQLRVKVAQAIIGMQDVAEMLNAGVEAYFAWCDDMGPLVGPIYSEINDPESPASTHRIQIIKDFVTLFHTEAQRLGEPRLDPLLYDSLLRAVEHAGSQAFWPERLPDAQIEKRKQIAKRIMLSTIIKDADSLALTPSVNALVETAD